MFAKVRVLFVGAGLGMLALSGCTDANPRLEVKGTVTFKGAPLEHGNIQFLTTVGSPGAAAGSIIKNGAYNVPRDHGLEPGTYRVLISSSVPVKVAPAGWPAGETLPNVERIPAEFSSFERSKVQCEVKPPSPVVLDFTIP